MPDDNEVTVNPGENTGDIPDLTEEENENENEEAGHSMSAIISKSLVEQVFTFEPDELISGSEQGFGIYDVVLRTQGEYKRGELLMLSDNQYVKATAEGAAGADSLVILADDVVVGEDEYAEVMCYSSGRFMSAKVILPYETENDSHAELIDAIRYKLMQLKIYLD